MSAPERPVLRYYGGKWKLAPWVLSHLPAHHVYVEPFGGAASVLLLKPRSYGEVYNDLDGEVVNVFRVLQDPAMAEALRWRIALTPFSREEFRRAYHPSEDPLERAWAMIVRAFMGFGSASMTRMHVTGFRSNSNRSGTTPAQDWMNWPEEIPAFVERLRGVVIENRDAAVVMEQHDEPRAVHYVDPPYVPSTRSSLAHKNGKRGHYYRHDMTEDEHVALSLVLHTLTGMVVLSGYRCPLYDALYGAWRRVDRDHMADGARARVESLWLNPAATKAQSQWVFEI